MGKIKQFIMTSFIWFHTSTVFAQEKFYMVYDNASSKASSTGISAIWILANISYAGMRAQSHPGTAWRVVSFLFGFPGTLLSFFVVQEGSERAYGIDIPKKY